MKAYAAFLNHLTRLAEHEGSLPPSGELKAALDGQAGRDLREMVPLEARRIQGAFFTDSERAKGLLANIPDKKLNGGFIVDPQCGAGNLLLAAARRLPLKSTPAETLALWGQHLGGLDIAPEFVQATKLRLWLLAVDRCKMSAKIPSNLDRHLPHICVADSQEDTKIQSRASVLLLNPPYGVRLASEDCAWSTGSVCSAAIFAEDSIRKSSTNAIVAGILPDVLRSGTRYHLWRRQIESLGTVKQIELGGIFDPHTDVDVFLLTMQRGSSAPKPFNWTSESITTAKLIRDEFDVHVGPVVPFRNPNLGPWYPYLTMSELAPWTTITDIKSRCRFKGTTYEGPFVAVCRVSRPDDQFRARATLISVDRPVAVENHIIICQPKDGTKATCRVLLKSLQKPATNVRLNQVICCRHLTTRSLLELPVFQ